MEKIQHQESIRERRLESWNRRCMRYEDRAGRKLRKFMRARLFASRLLSRWEEHELTQKRRDERKKKAEQAQNMAEKKRKRVSEMNRKAAETAIRRKVWRWMCRPDITMEEIFKARRQEPDE